MPESCEVLGYSNDAKLLIVSCDDLGAFHSMNVAVYQALRDGWATTAGLMVPAPWAREAAARYRGEDIGVHLTLNAEHELFRWSPLTQAPSLLGGDGGFPRSVTDLWEHADLDEVRRECKAQIERAIYWGFDVTHLDSHMGVLTFRPEFFDVLVDLAVEFQLPVRLPDASAHAISGFPFRRLAKEEGLLIPDHVVSLGRDTSPGALEEALHALQPGITELVFRPAVDSPELRAVTHDWTQYVVQSERLSNSSGFAQLSERAGATRIGYRALREAQRKAMN